MSSSWLITGGTGTLGQALVKRLLASDAERICIYSRDEFKQYEMREEIADPDKRLRYFIGDVRDLKRLRRAFEGVDYVVHAAALKQIDAMEFNPLEAVRTNIGGTENVIEAALDSGVKRVLLVSTDKAHAPTTLYGATKLCAERIIFAANNMNGGRNIKFGAVRLGNIAFSRGSVIPKWKALVAAGAKELPVTHPDCTRYWLLEEEAASYIWNWFHFAEFLMEAMPLMPAYRVGDLAEAFGLPMKVTGLRPGERLHEHASEHAQRLDTEVLRALIA